MVIGIERHAVFVRSWSLAENLPRSLLRVQLLHIGWRFARSRIVAGASMRLDVIDFGRHEPAPLPLLTHHQNGCSDSTLLRNRCHLSVRYHCRPPENLRTPQLIPGCYSSQFTSFAGLARGSR